MIVGNRAAERPVKPARQPSDVQYPAAARWKDHKIVEEHRFCANGPPDPDRTGLRLTGRP